MSGKKKSEVETVLKGADESRKAIFDKRFKDLEDSLNRLEEIKQTHAIKDIDISSQLRILKRKREEINSINKEVRALENSMKNRSSHYMDEEFSKATELLEGYENISTELIELKAEIQKKTNKALKKHLELKNQAEKRISLVEQQIESIKYPEPLNQDNLLDIAKICEVILDDDSASDDIYITLKQMKKHFSKNNFDSVIKDSELLESKVEEFQQKVEKALLKINENLSTAGAVYAALGFPRGSKIKGLGYRLETEFIDGKVARGIIIKTIENDDITFTLNNVVEYDKVDIDMIVNGNCQVKVKDIQEKLAQMAIPLNVTDWGTASEDNTGSEPKKQANNKLEKGK